MKKNIVFVTFFLLFIICHVFAQPSYKSADSPTLAAHTMQIQKISKQVDTLKINTDSIKTKVTLLTNETFDKNNDFGFFLCLLPGLLFIIMLAIIYTNLKKDKFSLADALVESDPSTKTILNKEYNVANINAIATQPLLAAQITTLLPPTFTITNDVKLRSSSRYLAVITSFTALIIAVCMIIFFMYSFIKNPDKPVNFTGMSAVLVSLIVGIAPYSFNKLSEGIKSKP